MANATQEKVEVSRPDGPAPAGRPEPIIVDLGKQKRKKIRRLRKGRGPLFAKVMEAHAQLDEQGILDDARGPVIVLVKEKKAKGWKRRSRTFLW